MLNVFRALSTALNSACLGSDLLCSNSVYHSEELLLSHLLHIVT